MLLAPEEQLKKTAMQKSVARGYQGKGRALVNETMFWRKRKKANVAGAVIDGECGSSEVGEVDSCARTHREHGWL